MLSVRKQRTGAKRVHVFDHTLRSGDEDFRNENLVREPVARVHNDYTEWSGPNRVSDILPDEAEELLGEEIPLIVVFGLGPTAQPEAEIKEDYERITSAFNVNRNELV